MRRYKTLKFMTEDPFQRFDKPYILIRRVSSNMQWCFHKSSPRLLCCSQLQLSIIRIPVSNPEKLTGPSSWAWMKSSFTIIVLSPRKKKNVIKVCWIYQGSKFWRHKRMAREHGTSFDMVTLTWFLITALLGMYFLKWVDSRVWCSSSMSPSCALCWN